MCRDLDIFFLILAHGHESVVQPVVDELLARLGFTLGDFVFVVGEFQVLPAPMDVQGIT